MHIIPEKGEEYKRKPLECSPLLCPLLPSNAAATDSLSAPHCRPELQSKPLGTGNVGRRPGPATKSVMEGHGRGAWKGSCYD